MTYKNIFTKIPHMRQYIHACAHGGKNYYS